MHFPRTFELSAEQQMLEDSVQRFLAAHCDFAARTRRLAGQTPFDPALWSEFANMGWLGLEIAEADGGMGLGPLETLLLMQGFGRELVTEPYLACIVLGAGIVREAATAEQKQRLLPAVAAGERLLAFGFAEPQARYDAANVTTTARPQGGGWCLNGSKCVVLGAPAAHALIVSARTSGAPCDAKGLSLFLVPSDAQGLTLRGYRNVDGHAAAEVMLAGVRLDASALLGEEGGAFGPIQRTLDRACAAVVAEAAGAMARSVEITRDYLMARSQYGQPLASFQVLRHRVVDMYIAMEETRSLAQWAAHALAGPDEARMLAVSAAKAHAGEAGKLAGQHAVQLHGGMGIVEEYPIGHYLKRLTAIDRLFGDRNFHLDRYASLTS
jgi:alkylation response protein AidB-like acyl-CoA dehydrogenase